MLGNLISPKASPRTGPNIEGRSFQGALFKLVMRVVVGHMVANDGCVNDGCVNDRQVNDGLPGRHACCQRWLCQRSRIVGLWRTQTLKGLRGPSNMAVGCMVSTNTG